MAKLVTLAHFFDLTEAQVVRALLDQHGVCAFVADTQTATVQWHLFFAIGGVRLQIAEIDVGLAQSILGEDHALPDNDLTETCPRCSSTNVMRLASPLFSILALIVFVPFAHKGHLRQCRDCRKYWEGDWVI